MRASPASDKNVTRHMYLRVVILTSSHNFVLSGLSIERSCSSNKLKMRELKIIENSCSPSCANITAMKTLSQEIIITFNRRMRFVLIKHSKSRLLKMKSLKHQKRNKVNKLSAQFCRSQHHYFSRIHINRTR